MSPLAFDKQGKPFTWHKRTAKLRVRLFRNPSARGTCCQVLDGVGAPLYVEADIDYAEFRRAVGGVPGLYRLDQCDEDGVELEDAAPAYVSIEQLRNAGASVEGSIATDPSALLIIERLVALHTDVMKTMTSQHAAILASSAEVMRAPYRPMPAASVVEVRNAESSAGEDDDREEEDDEVAEEPNALAPVLGMLEPHLPRLGAFLYQKVVEFFRTTSTTTMATVPTAPAATSVPTPPRPRAAAPARAAVWPDVAAGQEDEESSPPAPVELDTPVTEAPPTPTPAQLAHLFTVRERLSASEQALVEHVIQRMSPTLMAQYLTTLSAMSVDDATTFIRSLIAESSRSSS